MTSAAVPVRARKPIIALGVAALYGVAALTVPTVISCPIRALTGLDCALCGGTRAVLTLLRGDFVGALDHNAVFVVVVAVLVMSRSTAGPSGQRAYALLESQRVRIGAIAALAVWTTVRNVPLFDWLASGIPN